MKGIKEEDVKGTALRMWHLRCLSWGKRELILGAMRVEGGQSDNFS